MNLKLFFLLVICFGLLQILEAHDGKGCDKEDCNQNCIKECHNFGGCVRGKCVCDQFCPICDEKCRKAFSESDKLYGYCLDDNDLDTCKCLTCKIGCQDSLPDGYSCRPNVTTASSQDSDENDNHDGGHNDKHDDDQDGSHDGDQKEDQDGGHKCNHKCNHDAGQNDDQNGDENGSDNGDHKGNQDGDQGGIQDKGQNSGKDD